MRRKLVIRPEALAEIDEAAAWYEPRRRFLAKAFIDAVDAGIAAVARDPERFPILEDDARISCYRGSRTASSTKSRSAR